MSFMDLKNLKGKIIREQKHGSIEVAITQTKIGPREMYHVHVFENGKQISNHSPMTTLEEASFLYNVQVKGAKAINSDPFFAITHENANRKEAFPDEIEARRIAGITATLKHKGFDLNTKAVKRILAIAKKMRTTPAQKKPRPPKKEFKPTKLRLLPKPPRRK